MQITTLQIKTNQGSLSPSLVLSFLSIFFLFLEEFVSFTQKKIQNALSLLTKVLFMTVNRRFKEKDMHVCPCISFSNYYDKYPFFSFLRSSFGLNIFCMFMINGFQEENHLQKGSKTSNSQNSARQSKTVLVLITLLHEKENCRQSLCSLQLVPALTMRCLHSPYNGRQAGSCEGEVSNLLLFLD